MERRDFKICRVCHAYTAIYYLCLCRVPPLTSQDWLFNYEIHGAGLEPDAYCP